MKKLLAFGVLAACASGCVIVGESNARSAIMVDVVSPETQFVDNDVKPTKVGTATARGIVCFTEGDCSIKAAMDNGGIKKVHHIDYKVTSILGVYGTTTTQVYGE